VTTEASHSEASTAIMLNDVRVDFTDLSLTQGEHHIRLEPRVMGVLQAFASDPARPWTRGALIDQVWGAGEGSDESLSRAIYVLRKVFRQFDSLNEALTTIPKRGYRLTASVHALDPANKDERQASPPDLFSVAVLPFSSQFPGKEDTYLSDGLTRDLTALLARAQCFRVIPHSSAASLNIADKSSLDIARQLDTRHIVRGSLVRSEEEIRVRIELVDAVDNTLLWSNRYDAALDQFYEIEDDAVESISTAIAASLKLPRPQWTPRNKTFNLSVYQRLQEAEVLRLNYSPETAKKIIALLEEILAIAPGEPVVSAALAVQLSQNVVSRWTPDLEGCRHEADRLIAASLSQAPDNPEVLTAAGIVSAMFHRPDDAIGYLQRSLARDPNDAHALAVLGWQKALRHADRTGIAAIETAERRAPHHPRFGLWATYRATAHLFLLEYEAGLLGAREASIRTPGYYQPFLHCAWACVGLGDTLVANSYIEQAEKILPGIVPTYVDEMKQWSENSPNASQCHEVLDSLSVLSV